MTSKEVKSCLACNLSSVDFLHKCLKKNNFPYEVDEIQPSDWASYSLALDRKDEILRMPSVNWYDKSASDTLVYSINIGTRSPEQHWTGGARSGFEGYTILLNKSHSIIGYFKY